MKRLNKKGFTLVELLAVIVILALLMVVATSTIGGTLTNAKKNTLRTEAQKMLTAIYGEAKSSYMLSSNLSNMTTSTDSTLAMTGYTVYKYVDGKYTGYFSFSNANTTLVSMCFEYNKTTAAELAFTLSPGTAISINGSDTSATPQLDTYNSSISIQSNKSCAKNGTTGQFKLS